MKYDRYFDNREVQDILRGWAKQYRNLLSVDRIGSSHDNHPIWLATVTDKATGPADTKPAIWIDANLHATEIAGTTAALHLIETLLRGAKNKQIKKILETSTFYIVPRADPDGAAWAMAKKPKWVRSGVRRYPWPERDDGLHAEDVDNNGLILQMRIEDPNGDWKISTLHPKLMEKRAPNEHGGTYYRLLPEGVIENYDGYITKIGRPTEGLDFNRNFPSSWRPEGEQYGAGPYPASEPEVAALVDFVSSHPNINCALTYHTYSGVILRPYGTKDDNAIETSDLWVYQSLGEIGKQATGYPCISVYHDFRYHPKEVITGVFDDWCYDHLGIFAFTVELWDVIGKSGIKKRKFIEWFRQHPHKEDLKIYKWVKKNGEKNSYVDWKPFKHPQLGDIEIGGWNLFYTFRNPPRHFMGEEAEKTTRFALELAKILPHLSLHTLKVESLGDGTYKLLLVVENTGFLPSYTSQQTRKRGMIRPVRVELSLPKGTKLESGRKTAELGHLEGRSNKIGGFYYPMSPTDNRAKMEWVIKAPKHASVELKISSERAGVLKKKIELRSKQ